MTSGSRPQRRVSDAAVRLGNVLEERTREVEDARAEFRAGDRMRITAQLVSVGDGSLLWSESYDRDARDAFALDQTDPLVLAVQQRSFDDFRQRRRPTSSPQPAGASLGEFTFVRIIYDSPTRGYGRRVLRRPSSTRSRPPSAPDACLTRSPSAGEAGSA